MRQILIYIALSVLLGLVSGCNRQAKKTYRIGVAQCSSDAWRWQTNDEIERELMFHDNAVVEIRTADDLNEKQIESIRYFMDNDFDLIIVNPTQADAITPIVEEAYAKGIPIVTFDRRINGESYTAHLEVDNEGLGREAAAYALTLFPNGAKIIEVQGHKDMTPTIRRHNGFVDVIATYPEMQIVSSVYGNWNPDIVAFFVDSLLTLHPDIDLIYAHSDIMAISASETARKRGLNHIKFLGIDGCPDVGIKAVSDSVLAATFLYPTYGYKLILTALAILENRPYDREVILPPVSAVDAKNADILLQQDGVMKEETNKIILLKAKIDEYWSQRSAQTTLLYAAGIIVLLLFGVISLLLSTFWLRGRHQKILMEKNKLLEEERDKQKTLYQQLDAATQSKLIFFTNVSHDLRTPLTLIAEPVDQLAGAEYLTPQHRSLMKIASKNTKILRRLIDQILDFRKYENGKLSLHLTEVSFYMLVREWIDSFYTLAHKKDIKLTVDIPEEKEEALTLALDTEKIERVFFNLMSNAFKYTPNNGKIHFACQCDEKKLTFFVKNSGEGIGKDDIERVFDRFYQVDKLHPKGSGIGLSLAKAFIELHGGSISVESEVGKGAQFTVVVPVRHTDKQPEITVKSIAEKEVIADLAPIETERCMMNDQKPVILVIDDNRDIRTMITALLCAEYNVITANDGQQGIKLAAKYVPDLIICDVMMPVMDGLGCCRIIKEEVSTSHIPVLMLTACSLDDQRVQGYDSGADGYLSKPFSAAVLLSRCKNLLLNRKRIKDIFIGGAEQAISENEGRVIPYTSTIGDIDSEFYAQFLSILKEEMDKPDLSIDQIANQMGLGQSQFTRKIKALTNYTPVELIRSLRLKQARMLLSTTEKSISEIAYEVGFTSPAYFSKCYKDAYRETPSELRSRLTNK